MNCIFCYTPCSYGIELNDGRLVHYSCFDKAKNELNWKKRKSEFLMSELSKYKLELSRCNSEIQYNENKGIITSIIDFFFGNKSKYTLYDRNVLTQKVSDLQNEYNRIDDCDYLSNLIYLVEVSIQEKVNLIKEAIEMNCNIEFEYKKTSEKYYKVRTVKPYGFEKVQHVRDPNNYTLCVNGFCYMRNASRTFAIKRMKNLIIL